MFLQSLTFWQNFEISRQLSSNPISVYSLLKGTKKSHDEACQVRPVLFKFFFSRTTAKIPNRYSFHYLNTKNVQVLKGISDINVYCQDTGRRRIWFVGKTEVFSPANQQNNNPLETSNFALPAFLI